MSQVFVVLKYDSLCESDTVISVALTSDAAAEAVAEAVAESIQEEIECSVDHEEEAEEWREELLAKGVPASVASTLTPPASVVTEAKERAAARAQERYSFRSYPVPLIK